MNRAKKMKREKKLNNLYRAFGLTMGGVTGGFIGYQLGELFGNGEYEGDSTLSFLLSLTVGSIGCIVGFFLIGAINNNIRGQQ